MAKPSPLQRDRKKRAQAFYNYCKRLGACEEGLLWIKGKTYQEAWEQLTNPCWMLWLVQRAEYPLYGKVYTTLSIAAEKANTGYYIGLTGMFRGGEWIPSEEAHGRLKICNAIRRCANIQVTGM
jgi:hypothetical protein